MWPDRLYNITPNYLINGMTFEKKNVVQTKMCVLISAVTYFETFLILRKTEQDMIKNVYWSSHKVHVFILVRF